MENKAEQGGSDSDGGKVGPLYRRVSSRKEGRMAKADRRKGKKSVNDLIAMIQTKEILSDDQKTEIASWAPTQEGMIEMRVIHELVQGSDEWAQFRLTKFGASEAAAMLGISTKVKRTELLHMKHTGTAKEFSDWVQKNILDYGHEVEALARPIIEELIGEDLYPVTCSDGDLSASCDGLTMSDEIAFEHKQWATALAASVKAGVLPDEYQPQCQQVMMVTGAQKVIFGIGRHTGEHGIHGSSPRSGLA
jgi:hypothetical protein